MPRHDTPRTALTVVGGDYEHTLGLGRVRDGLALTYETRPIVSIFEAMLAERAFPVCEMSLANYLMVRDRGDDWMSAIPVFPYRAFRHSALYVRTDSALHLPTDLVGRRVGVPDYAMTAGVWLRGILKDHHGVDWRDIVWHAGASRRFPPLAGVPLQPLEGSLEDALLEHRVDAIVLASAPASALARNGTAPTIRRLFRDARAEEEAYHRRTGIYPIMHTVVIRRDALERHPGLPRLLFDAYQDAKRRAVSRRLSQALLPWGKQAWEQVDREFGGDPLPYGLGEANHQVVARLYAYLVDQGLARGQLPLDSLFVDVGPGDAARSGADRP